MQRLSLLPEIYKMRKVKIHKESLKPNDTYVAFKASACRVGYDRHAVLRCKFHRLHDILCRLSVNDHSMGLT